MLLIGRPKRTGHPQRIANLIDLMIKRPLSNETAASLEAAPGAVKDRIGEQLALKEQPVTVCLKNKTEKYTT